MRQIEINATRMENGHGMSGISVRPYLPSDADATADIFLRAIREIAIRDYSPEQVQAWAQIDDRKQWAISRGNRPAWIAEMAARPIGFSDLVPDGYLDMMFVHPEFQGLGVASLLLNQVEQHARELGLARVYTEASLTAKPFFERRGFQVLKSQQVEKRGQTLPNFVMEKRLAVYSR